MNKLVSLLAVSSLISATCIEAQAGVYLGAGVGPGFLEGAKLSRPFQFNQSTYEQNATALAGRINGGYRFDNGFGVELGYAAFNSVTDHPTSYLRTTTKQNNVDLLGTYMFSLNSSRTLMADFGLGIAYKTVEYKEHFEILPTWKRDFNMQEKGYVPTALAGLRYNLTSNVDLTAQYRVWSRQSLDNNYVRMDRAQAVLFGGAYRF